MKIHALSQQYGTDPPRIHFDEESGLRSTEFDDMYFPPHQGLEAAFHVFCRPNQIQERWKKKTHFCISELGFGTGLNFFATALLWRRSGPASGHLSFRSFEKFPLAPAVIREALSPYQEICDIVDGYCTQAPSPLLGLHRLIFSDLRITLDLYYGEALHSLEETQFSADAWYFDGFAPRRNPEMWSEELFRQIALHSSSGTTVSTFSVSGAVRRSLQAAGFEIERFQGFQGKRESIKGTLRIETRSNWKPPSKIAIIGGGLAGASLAHACDKRGIACTLFERHQELAQEASGNPAGVLLPYIARRPNPMSVLYLLGFEYSLRQLGHLQSKFGLTFENSGVVHFPSTERLEKLWSELEALKLPETIVLKQDSARLKRLLGTSVSSHGFYYPRGGWCAPREYAKALVSDAKLLRIENGTSIEKLDSNDNRWAVISHKRQKFEDFDSVIIANAADCKALIQTSRLPLHSVRGQLSYVDPVPASAQIRQVICYDGYLLPQRDGFQIAGASYDHNNEKKGVSPGQNRQLLARIPQWLPQIDFLSQDLSRGRVAFRASTYDRLPFVGTVPHFEGVPEESSAFVPQQLHLFVGFGSRGLISIPLLAEILVEEIATGQHSLPLTLRRAISPERCLAYLAKRTAT